MSASIAAFMTGFAFHSGCFGARALTRARANASWKQKGFSLHKVPSLSKTAIRSSGGTKSELPYMVTRVTNRIIAAFTSVSFHDGRS